jgi:hypothetical protein
LAGAERAQADDVCAEGEDVEVGAGGGAAGVVDALARVAGVAVAVAEERHLAPGTNVSFGRVSVAAAMRTSGSGRLKSRSQPPSVGTSMRR